MFILKTPIILALIVTLKLLSENQSFAQGASGVGNGPGFLTQNIAVKGNAIEGSYDNQVSAHLRQMLDGFCQSFLVDPSRARESVHEIEIEEDLIGFRIYDQDRNPMSYEYLCDPNHKKIYEAFVEFMTCLNLAIFHPSVRQLLAMIIFEVNDGEEKPISVILTSEPGIFHFSGHKVEEFTWYHYVDDYMIWSKRPPFSDSVDAKLNRPSAAFFVHNLGHVFTARALNKKGFGAIEGRWHTVLDGKQIPRKDNLYAHETSPLAAIVESFSNLLEIPFLTMYSRHPFMMSASEGAICQFNADHNACYDDRFRIYLPAGELSSAIARDFQSSGFVLSRNKDKTWLLPKDWQRLNVVYRDRPDTSEALKTLLIFSQLIRLGSNEAYLSTSLNKLVDNTPGEVFFADNKRQVDCKSEKNLTTLIMAFERAAQGFRMLSEDLVSDPWAQLQSLLLSWMIAFDEIEHDNDIEAMKSGRGRAYMREFFFFDTFQYAFDGLQTGRLPQDFKVYFHWPVLRVEGESVSFSQDPEMLHFEELSRSELYDRPPVNVKHARRQNQSSYLTCR